MSYWFTNEQLLTTFLSSLVQDEKEFNVRLEERNIDLKKIKIYEVYVRSDASHYSNELLSNDEIRDLMAGLGGSL